MTPSERSYKNEDTRPERKSNVRESSTSLDDKQSQHLVILLYHVHAVGFIPLRKWKGAAFVECWTIMMHRDPFFFFFTFLSVRIFAFIFWLKHHRVAGIEPGEKKIIDNFFPTSDECTTSIGKLIAVQGERQDRSQTTQKRKNRVFFIEQIEIGLRFSLPNVLPPSVSLYFVPRIDVSQIVHSLIFLGVVIIFFLYCYYFDSSTQQIVNDPTCKIINPDGDWRPVATM